MGYYVQLRRSNLVIENEVKAEVLQRWKDLNKPENNHLKHGGSWGPGDERKYWFSWMDENYDKEVKSVEDVLKMLGFEYEVNTDGDIELLNYDNKTGQEDLFFETIADLIPAGSAVGWQGEDGAIILWLFDGKKMITSTNDPWELMDKFMEEPKKKVKRLPKKPH